MTKTDECLSSTFRAFTIPSNVTFRLYFVFQLSCVHENFHSWLWANSQQTFDFGCNWSIIKGPALEEQRTISAVTRIPLEGFYLKFILRHLQEWGTVHKSCVSPAVCTAIFSVWVNGSSCPEKKLSAVLIVVHTITSAVHMTGTWLVRIESRFYIISTMLNP